MIPWASVRTFAGREAFLQAHGASLYTAHGATMPEYVTVSPQLLADTARMRRRVTVGGSWLLRKWERR